MSEEFDAVFLDAGGTLIDLDPPRHEVMRQVLSKHGFDVSSSEAKKALDKTERAFDEETATLQGSDERLFWRKFDAHTLKMLGIEADPEAIEKDLSEAFYKATFGVNSWKPYPDAKPLLDDLGKRDFVVGMVSNATDLLRRVLDNLGFANYFDVLVISDEVGVRKPAPEIFWIACRQAGVPPNRCLYIGDKFAVDIVGAKNAGLNAILLDRPGIFSDVDCVKVRDLNAIRHFLWA